MLTITLQQLTDLRACEPAARLFSEQFGDRLDIPEYTPQHQEWLVRSEWRRYLGWVWGNNVLPQWSMSGADLSGADLRGADLRGANLSWADLSGADLSGADLSWADLSWANLSEADLSWADLRGANLSEADLSGADLSEADLRWAVALLALDGWSLIDGRLERAEAPR